MRKIQIHSVMRSGLWVLVLLALLSISIFMAITGHLKIVDEASLLEETPPVRIVVIHPPTSLSVRLCARET